ncbi:MAG: Ditrans,polycis-undecaprenyl-diphosphate synthase ((2E,6E)-farnesyl-diphosphate specific) [Holosporales bacterium]
MKTPPPKSVAIILDGNGRWAKRENLPLINGHKKGADVAFDIAEEAHRLGVEWLTYYTFSTENFNRPKHWILDFKTLLKWYLKHETQRLFDSNVKLHIIGDFHEFGPEISELIQTTLLKTEKNTGLNLVLALNYGSRSEITRAAQRIGELVQKGALAIHDITEQTISEHLYTRNMPDPDLMIRTSGEIRLSNYLLWQLAYAEFSFTNKLWPDYTKADFEQAITHYQKRERRYGQYTAN